jgi:hypothetical protein
METGKNAHLTEQRNMLSLRKIQNFVGEKGKSLLLNISKMKLFRILKTITAHPENANLIHKISISRVCCYITKKRFIFSIFFLLYIFVVLTKLAAKLKHKVSKIICIG